LLITGDDVLIEYVARLMIAVKSVKEHLMRPAWKNQIEKFIKHYVWHSSDVRRAENNMLWQRLESRLIEMKERRKRLLKSLFKKENPQQTNSVPFGKEQKGSQTTLTHTGMMEFEKEYELKEEQKNVIIQGFSAAQLEEMLRTSTKNVAYEVISCLIDASGKGVLTEIIKWLTTCNNQNLLNDNESILD
jgi:predicted metal-dependent hydrolase